MADNLDAIQLYSEQHAIEVVNFTVRLASPLDKDDIRRFEEKEQDVKRLFPLIETLPTFQIAFGSPGHRGIPDPVDAKKMSYFETDGFAVWVATFQDNFINIACRRYTRWIEVWPKAKERILLLLSLIDPYKKVHSLDFGVTDSFYCETNLNVLTAKAIFSDNELLPKKLLTYEDPRWDFSQGFFEGDEKDQLSRIDARGILENGFSIVSINNMHSKRFLNHVTVNSLLEDNDETMNAMFNKFHDLNKNFLKRVLKKRLLERMGLLKGE